ncbi:MAG: VOC family protein, partial [Sphingomonadaceae bacterium]
GPFVIRRHISMPTVRYRGEDTRLSISAAHAQSGGIQIELVQQHGEEASTFRDMYRSDETGLHHSAVWPASYEQMVQHYERLGCAVTTELLTAEGRGAAFVDARKLLGHMVEIYRPADSLGKLYEWVADVAHNWDGKELRIET